MATFTSSELVKKTASYVRLKQLGEHTGHDWFHTERVWNMARFLQSKEGGDIETIELLALLHDVGDTKNYEFEKQKGPLVLRGMMDILDISKERHNQLIKIIEEMKFRGDDTVSPSIIEGKIVQDADFLDSLGAVGTARIFATGGSIGRILHNPKQKPRHKLVGEDYIYRKQAGTSVNYFYEKILKLPKMLNTVTAQNIAKQRTKFTEDFLAEFLKEWEGEKL